MKEKNQPKKAVSPFAKKGGFRFFGFLTGFISIIAVLGGATLLAFPFGGDNTVKVFLSQLSGGLSAYVFPAIFALTVLVSAIYLIVGAIKMFKKDMPKNTNVRAAFVAGLALVFYMVSDSFVIKLNVSFTYFDYFVYAFLGAMAIRFFYQFVLILAGRKYAPKIKGKLFATNFVGLIASVGAVAAILFLCKDGGRQFEAMDFYYRLSGHDVIGVSDALTSLVSSFSLSGALTLVLAIVSMWIMVEAARTAAVIFLGLFKLLMNKGYVRNSKYFSKTSPFSAPLKLVAIPLFVNVLVIAASVINATGFYLPDGTVYNAIGFGAVLLLCIVYGSMISADKHKAKKAVASSSSENAEVAPTENKTDKQTEKRKVAVAAVAAASSAEEEKPTKVKVPVSASNDSIETVIDKSNVVVSDSGTIKKSAFVDDYASGETIGKSYCAEKKAAEARKAQQIKPEEVKPEEIKAEEIKPAPVEEPIPVIPVEEIKVEEVKPEEIKAEEIKFEEVKAEEVKPEEVKPFADSADEFDEEFDEEIGAEEIKPEEVKAEESKTVHNEKAENFSSGNTQYGNPYYGENFYNNPYGAQFQQNGAQYQQINGQPVVYVPVQQGQYVYGQPVYGQPYPPQGQPVYGQPVYGQPYPPQGQPVYGQPAYGQPYPQQGQPVYGQQPQQQQPQQQPAQQTQTAPADTEADEDDEPSSAAFLIPKKPLEEKLADLSAAEKSYYKQVIAHASGKIGAKRIKGIYADSVYYGRELLVKVQIKQSKIVCQFSLVDYKVKQMLKNRDYNAKQEQTVVKVVDKVSFEAAIKSIDMAYELAISAKEQKHQEQLKRRREARATANKND